MMKLDAKRFVALSAVILLLVTAALAGQPKEAQCTTTATADLPQARNTVIAAFRAAHAVHFSVDPQSFRFLFDSIEFDGQVRGGAPGEHFKISLKSLPPVVVSRRWDSGYKIKDETGNNLPYPLERIIFWSSNRATDAACLAAGLNSLREHEKNRQAILNDFSQRAVAWRAMPVKPPIPEEVRLHRILAEGALKERKPSEALDHYEMGLGLFPTWPQGWFNAALIAAELGFYEQAAEHMRAYLELVPDAQDAQNARDQIAVWNYKAKGSK